MTQELRRLAEDSQQWEAAGCPVTDPHDTYPQELFHAAANPAAILELLDRLEKAEKDAERLDWLEQNLFNRENVDWITGEISKTHNMWVTFAPVGVQGSARRIIDAGMEASK